MCWSWPWNLWSCHHVTDHCYSECRFLFLLRRTGPTRTTWRQRQTGSSWTIWTSWPSGTARTSWTSWSRWLAWKSGTSWWRWYGGPTWNIWWTCWILLHQVISTCLYVYCDHVQIKDTLYFYNNLSKCVLFQWFSVVCHQCRRKSVTKQYTINPHTRHTWHCTYFAVCNTLVVTILAFTEDEQTTYL